MKRTAPLPHPSTTRAPRCRQMLTKARRSPAALRTTRTGTGVRSSVRKSPGARTCELKPTTSGCRRKSTSRSRASRAADVYADTSLQAMWSASGGTPRSMARKISRISATWVACFTGCRGLLPLDRRGRLRGDVVDHAVDAADLVDDARREARQEIGRQPRPVGGHAVGGMHGPDRHHVLVRALVTHHADRLDRQEDREGLPELLVELRAANLLLDDGVGAAHDREPLPVDRPDHADGEPRARERMAADDLLGHAEHAPEAPHLVLEELAERLEELEPHPFGQAADVVMALDGGRGAAHRDRLDDVGVEGPLRQEADVGDLPRLLLEHLDEGPPDDPPLLLRLLDAAQVLEEARRRVDVAHVELHAVPADAEHLLDLAGAQEPVVDEDAGQAVADRPVHERRGHRRVDAAREGADDTLAPTRCRTRGSQASTKLSIVQSGRAPATRSTKLRRISLPSTVCVTSG